MITEQIVMTSEDIKHLKTVVRNISLGAGIGEPQVHLENGGPLGCTDMHVLTVTSGNVSICAKILHQEVKNISKKPLTKDTLSKLYDVVARLRKLSIQ